MTRPRVRVYTDSDTDPHANSDADSNAESDADARPWFPPSHADGADDWLNLRRRHEYHARSERHRSGWHDQQG